MIKRLLGRSGIEIAPLVLGGNVFGWTADEATSFDLLDRFTDAGLNAVDTADSYSKWVPGHRGGESETIIGNWLAASPSRRDQTVIITKVGSELAPDRKGLSARHILSSAEDSLRRLQTDHIDVYMSHYPDPETPINETLRAYETLMQQGKVRTIGSSNLTAAQLSHAEDVAGRERLPRYEVHEPEYNLYDREGYEGALREVCMREEIGVISYYSLASGFLTGKYRSAADLGQSPRGRGVAKYLNERGFRILHALDAVAASHDATPAAVAIAWVIARPGITAPIASATSAAQLDSLIRATQLTLSPEDMHTLDAASA